ncbi:MAG: thioredoxin-dependent thiol peroxidase [Saprospiraceae bacterium]
MSHLKAGDKAPSFSSTNEKGEVVTLEQFKGKKLVLYFYPKDDTPGCTAEACSIRDHYQRFLNAGYAVLGVSPDKEAKHQKFIDKYNLPFSLLADPDQEILKAYGVWGMKKFMGREYMGVLRTTFIIDEKGVIAEVISKVDTKEHANQIFDLMDVPA